MTQNEDKALEEFIKEQSGKGYIRPSKSPYASSFFFIKKRDGKLRPVQDYRKINHHTVRNQYPLLSRTREIPLLIGYDYDSREYLVMD